MTKQTKETLAPTAPNLKTCGVFTFKKPSRGAWISGVVLIGLCMGLGAWQLQRLEWKESLIAKIESAKDATRLTLRDLPENLDELADHEFRTIVLPGQFEHTHEFHLAGRRYNGVAGYDIVTPFRIAEHGGVILVNRGWVPNERKEVKDRKEDPRFDGIVFVSGVLLKPSAAPSYMPKNDTERNVWLIADTQEMGAIAGEKFPPVILETINPAPPPNTLPIPRAEGNINLTNDHLGYAFTWFSLAFAGLAIFFIYHLHSMKGDEDEDNAKKDAA